jgi:hypothetical protein
MKRNNVLYLGFPNRYFFEDRLGIHEWEKGVNVTLWLIVRAAAIDQSGSVSSLDSDGNVRLKAGDSIRIKLAGFEPGSIVEAWLFSTPQLMGTAKVAADGTVTGTFTIPKDVPKGSHRIALVTKTTDGKPTTLTVGVMVGEWKKGANVAIWLIVLPIVLSIAGALILPATRRRRTRTTIS